MLPNNRRQSRAARVNREPRPAAERKKDETCKHGLRQMLALELVRGVEESSWKNSGCRSRRRNLNGGKGSY